MSRWLALFLLSLSAPSLAQSQTKNESVRSVVQIRCATPDGDMKATGFVWPKQGYIVTALHAIAGCAPGKGLVYSEAAKKETAITAYVAADLEGDLALLKLDDDLGLPPMAISTQQAELTNSHIVWGYPLAAEQMIGLRIEFALGLDTDTTTLGRAFSSPDLTKLFRTQGYPQRNTKIFRVTTTIQPGHSGAPILDAEGRVVAIADGGLLGGWRGINWSIPASVYLPDLPNSSDPFPDRMSEQANLFSAATVREPVTVILGHKATSESDNQTDLDLVGTVNLPTVLDAYGIENNEKLSWMIKELTAVFPNRRTWEELEFSGFSPAGSDILVFVPEHANLVYDAATGYIEAISTDGSFHQVTINYEGASFEDAYTNGSATLFKVLSTLYDDTAPTALPDDAIDHDLEFVNYNRSLGNASSPKAVDFTIQVNGSHFSGRAVHRTKRFEDISDADAVDSVMMDIATFDLNSLAPLEDDIWALMNPKASQFGDDTSGPSVLTLVRRIPLSRVAEDFVAAKDFGWKRNLSELKARLDDPGEFDRLAFDIYEDRITGATIAVPSGLSLEWDVALGAAKASIGEGSVELAVSVERIENFAKAVSTDTTEFVLQVSNYAEWSNEQPSDCKLEVVPNAEHAQCWGYFEGTDRVTGEYADLYLALDVRDRVLLGTSVYIAGKEEDLTAEEAITYRMMLIAAEYLTDFAVK